MPGTLHQGILWVIQDDPWLPFDLLGRERPVSGTPVDRRAEVDRDARRELTLHPYFPDLVLVHRDPDEPTRGIVISVEAQEKVDPSKRWQIPVCQALLADEYRLPAWSVVVCLSRRTSAIMRGWVTGPPPTIDALVIDIDDVPRVGSIQEARRRPCAAILSAALHGAEEDLEAARVGMAVTRELPEQRQQRYNLTILAAVPKWIRTILLKEKKAMEKPEVWDIERRSGLFAVAHEEGMAIGHVDGRRKGRIEGRCVTLVELITTVFELRGVAMTPGALERIRACTDVETLERWSLRAREVTTAAELFDD